ncbi:MAG: hypothetical protein C0605_15060 [Hyphomicrobiales bacterium]|mgnify:FL=1|nr:MAG: hypothetical protein C0605_15060 [Hyphomicrobiales bacterium]
MPEAALSLAFEDGLTLSLFHNFHDLEDVWRSFESAALCTTFQNFDWLSNWFSHAGRHSNWTPCLVHGAASNGSTLFILPLGYYALGGLRILSWLGDSHSTYRMGLFDRQWIARQNPDKLHRLLRRVRSLLPPIDVVRLSDQPSSWEKTPNPFAAISALPTASYSHAIKLQDDFEALYASKRTASTIKKARKRERTFNRRYPLSFHTVSDTAELAPVMDELIRQKSVRLRDMGVHDFFADPGVRGFFKTLALNGLNGGSHQLRIYYMKAGDHIAATWMGLVHRGRICGLMNTMTDHPDIRRYSPGEVVLRYAISECCKDGLEVFDLAVGESRYKSEWCDQHLTLFETILPVTMKGHIYVHATRLGLRIKRLIKQSRKLWPLLQKTRCKCMATLKTLSLV